MATDYPTEDALQRARESLNESWEFSRQHPEDAHSIDAMVTTVASCPDSDLRPPDIPLASAYEHIYGSGSHAGCEWCKGHYQIAREGVVSALKKRSAAHSGFEC